VDLHPEHLHGSEEHERAPLYCESTKAGAILSYGITDSWVLRQIKNILWYLLGMPAWSAVATFGKESLRSHITQVVLQSPHPIRIGNVRFARAKLAGEAPRVVMMKGDSKVIGGNTILLHTGPRRADEGSMSRNPEWGNYQSINQQIGAIARRQLQEDTLAIEEDPQQDPPSTRDFVVAIFYVLFGVIAMAAGMVSIFIQ
jgi:hypothetical protein